MKKILSIFLFLLLACIPSMRGQEVQPIIHYGAVDDSTAAVYNVDGIFRGTLTLPSALLYEGKQLTVRAVFANAFQEQKIDTLILRPGIKVIGEQAFIGCYHLRAVVLPSTLTTLGSLAFADCVRLEQVTLSPKLEDIEEGVFYGCNHLKVVNIKEGTYNIRDGAFKDCKQLDNVVLPVSVNFIGHEAFAGCKALRHLKILGSDPNLMVLPDAFGDLDKSQITLIVPKGCKERYEQSKAWAGFSITE